MFDYSELRQVTSRDNPLVKQYIKLRDQKKYRIELGLFVLEGARLISDAVSEGLRIEYAFVTEQAANKYPETAAGLMKASIIGTYLIPESLGDVLSATQGSQGLYCCAHTLDKITAADKMNTVGKYLVLDNLQDPGNIGTIIRAADAVGIDGIFLCGCCDIYNPKTVRSTMGSMFRVPLVDDMDYESVISLLHACGIMTFASVVDADARDIRRVSFAGGSAVVIGNEGNGLTERDASLCNQKITIKMKGNINSLNAASAASIILWEMTDEE